MKNLKLDSRKLILILGSVGILLGYSTTAVAGDCGGTLEIVFPEWISSTTGSTCCSDPKGYDDEGEPDDNVPSDPPADGIWERASNLRGCGDCVVLTTYKIFDEDGMEVGSGPTPPDSHAADGTFHRI